MAEIYFGEQVIPLRCVGAVGPDLQFVGDHFMLTFAQSIGAGVIRSGANLFDLQDLTHCSDHPHEFFASI